MAPGWGLKKVGSVANAPTAIKRGLAPRQGATGPMEGRGCLSVDGGQGIRYGRAPVVMSEKRPYRITCPRCRQEQSVELYESINIKTDPALRDQLMANQVNSVTCRNCEFNFRVDKTLVYNDPDRHLLIYWIPVADRDSEAGEEQFADLLRQLNAALPDDMRAPAVHLVFNRTELVERIFLLEAGLNERLIEYIKYTIYTRNTRLDPARKNLLFNTQDSTPEHLCFVVQDVATRKLEAVLQYDRKAYQALHETFAAEDKSADLLELFPGPHISARLLLVRESQAEGSEPPSPSAPT